MVTNNFPISWAIWYGSIVLAIQIVGKHKHQNKFHLEQSTNEEVSTYRILSLIRVLKQLKLDKCIRGGGIIFL